MTDRERLDWGSAPGDEPERPPPPPRTTRFDLWRYLTGRWEREEHGDMADPDGKWFRIRGDAK